MVGNTSDDATRRGDRRFLIYLAVAFILLFLGGIYYCSNITLMFPIRHVLTGRYKIEMQRVTEAIESYHKEYQRWPTLPGTDASQDHVGRTDGPIVHILYDFGSPQNPKNIRFLDFLHANNGHYGLIDDTQGAEIPKPDEVRIVDVWGELYYLSFDNNNDAEIPNPEAGTEAGWFVKHPQPLTLKTRTAIYSAGPDRDPKTWGDNITSWR